MGSGPGIRGQVRSCYSTDKMLTYVLPASDAIVRGVISSGFEAAEVLIHGARISIDKVIGSVQTNRERL